MKRILFLLLATILLNGCSVKKNTWMSRKYHELLTRYNIYFNGSEAYNKSLRTMEKGYKDDYTQLLPINPISEIGKKGANTTFKRSIEKGQKSIALHSIKTIPKSGVYANSKTRELTMIEEYNPFIDEAWLLMARSTFFQGDFLGAAVLFKYISQHFRNLPDRVTEANLWMARCYFEMDWFYDGERIIEKLTPTQLTNISPYLIQTVYASYYLKRKDLILAEQAIGKLALLEKDKLQRARLYFLLGQLAEMNGNRANALAAYGKVVSMNPPYELAFNAQIKQTEFYSGNESGKALKRLMNMSKKSSNKEFLDQINYAIGNIYIHQKDSAKAISYYEQAISKSTRKGIEQAVVEVKLGGIYFDRRLYSKAQPLYMSAVTKLPKTDPNYPLVEKRSSILDEFIVNYEKVQLQDSLLRLSKMSPNEQMKVAQTIVETLKKEEEERKKQEALDKLNAEREEMLGEQATNNKVQDNTINSTGDKSWYFYNPQIVSRGKSEYQRKWGSRKLEDHWRRRNKTVFNFEDQAADQTERTGNSNTEGTTPDSISMAEDDPMKPEFYLSQIPKTEEEITNAHEIIAEGLYNMADIYRSRLEDYPMAVTTYEELLRRYAEHAFLLQTYYALYLIGEKEGNATLKNEYAQKIQTQFPNSKEAKVIADPNFITNFFAGSKEQEKLYEKTYNTYLAKQYNEVIALCGESYEKYPISKVNAKFLYVDALAHNAVKDQEGFKNSLQKLIDNYPEDPASEVAGVILKGIAQGRHIQSSETEFGQDIWTRQLKTKEATDTESGATDFKVDPISAHLVLFVYPDDQIERNKLLYDIAEFQFRNYKVKEFTMDFLTFEGVGMLRVTPFINYDELLIYKNFLFSSDGLGNILPKTVKPILISEENFKILLSGKSIDSYLKFYQKNFTEK